MPFPTPLFVPEVELHEPLLLAAGVRVVVRREDLNHPEISGNKFWKLKYNIEAAMASGHPTLLTFGGAYSNHIAATAAACRLTGLRSVGIIRAEDADLTNPTLAKAREDGMKLHRISRADYKRKAEAAFVADLTKQYGPAFIVPEGGTNLEAIWGVQEMARQIRAAYDHIAVPVGTGGTLTGIVQELRGKGSILGFAVLKGGFMGDEVKKLHQKWQLPVYSNWRIVDGYHFGGYGKVKPALISFIHKFEDMHQIPLDQVYTGKMMYALYQMIEHGFFPRGSVIMVIHTGGLQGRNIM